MNPKLRLKNCVGTKFSCVTWGEKRNLNSRNLITSYLYEVLARITKINCNVFEG